MAMPATSPSSCQAPSPAGLPLLTSPRTRAGSLAFGRRRAIRLRGAAAAEPTGESQSSLSVNVSFRIKDQK
jgi:hypothetical protein